jgi:hypothetical protein
MKPIFISFLVPVFLSVIALSAWLQMRVKFYRDKRLSPQIFTFPETAALAHVHANFSRWAVPDSVKQQLWDFTQRAPLNPRTGHRSLALTIVNEGMIDFASNMICSLQLANVSSNSHFFIALDRKAYRSMLRLNAQVLLLEGGNFTGDAVNNKRIVEFYDIVKVKPTFIHQLLLWGVEPIPIDADVVFIENVLDMFTDSADFETQCDSKEYFRIPYWNDSCPWQLNLGYYKLHPTPVIMRLMPVWLTKMYNVPKMQDQSALRKLLRPMPTRWLNNDTIVVDVRGLFGNDPVARNITFRFLDPMLVTNAGGLWQEGKQGWKKEAKLRNIRRPRQIHFFHIGYITSKRNLIKEKELWFVQDRGDCVKRQPKGVVEWPLWK